MELIQHGENLAHLMDAIVATGSVFGGLLGEPTAELRAQFTGGGPVQLFTPWATISRLDARQVSELGSGRSTLRRQPPLAGPAAQGWRGPEPATLVTHAETYLLIGKTAGWDSDTYRDWLATTRHRLAASGRVPPK